MDKLTKTFQSGEVLKAQDLNTVKDKVNELVDNVNTGGSGGGGSITVDSSLSTTSTNPVQNKVVTAELKKKVDSEYGKGLSTNDYTTDDKNKLAGLNNYDDTAINKAISGEITRAKSAEQSLSNNKVDKVTGKGLSTNDYTDADKNKLVGLKNYEDDIKTIKDKVETLSSVSIPKLSLHNENMSGEFEYSNDGGVITQPVYSRAVRIPDLPKVSGESKSIAFSNEILGNGLYLVINNVSVSDSNGSITSSYLDKYKFDVESIGGSSSVKVTALEAIDVSLTAIVQVSYIKFNATKATVVLNCNSEEEANNMTLSIPHTKFDKQPFSVTLDDANTSHFCVTHLGINNRIMSPGNDGFMHANQYKAGDIPKSAEPALGYPLCFTDGCGNDRRFSVGCAVWPNAIQGSGAMMDSVNPIDPNANNQYRFMNPHLQWGDVKEMFKWGHSISQHNVNQDVWTNNDPILLKEGFAEDCAKSVKKVGRGLKIMTQPDGNANYTTAFETYDSLLLDVSERYQPVKPFTDFSFYKAKCFRKFPDPASGYLPEIATELAKVKTERPWLHLGQHRTVMAFVTDFLVPIYNTYGKAGADNIWFASADEVYEYLYMRKHAQIKKTVNGTKATFDIYFAQGEFFYYPELTFIPSHSNFTVESLSDNISGFSINNAKTMFNINLSKNLLEMSEECVSIYESTSNSTDRDDALYFVNQLKPGAVKDAFNTRIDAVASPVLITGISITTKPTTIVDSVRLSIAYTPSDTTQTGVNWSSSDTSVATVDVTGNVTVLNAGSVTITATSKANGSISDSFITTCSVTQTSIPVTGLSISGGNNVNVGDSLQLSVSYTPANTTQKGVNWSSSDPLIATVDNTGRVTALTAGSVTITATSSINNSISTDKLIEVNTVSVGNATAMLGEYSWIDNNKVDHIYDGTANKYITNMNANGGTPIPNNIYDIERGEVLSGWSIMSNDEKKGYYEISTLDNWSDAPNQNATNPNYSILYKYQFAYKYGGTLYPILGYKVPNGNYKVSILAYTTEIRNFKDGHLEINKVEQTMPDLNLQNNQQWVEFPQIAVTDGKIVLRMWGNPSKNVGLNIIKIEKLS